LIFLLITPEAGIIGLRTHIPDNWVTRLFNRADVDLRALRDRLPKEFDLVVSNPADVLLDNALRILAACEHLTAEPNFGLRLAKQSDFHDMGVYGYLLINAHTLGQFFELAAKYFGVLIRTSKIYYKSDQFCSRFEYQIVSPVSESIRHDVDWSFGAYVYFARKVLGESWLPPKCGVTYASPPDTSHHLAFYGPNLEFEQRTNYFQIEKDLLELPINDADPRLLELIRDHADLLMAKVQQSPDFLHQVRLLALQSVNEGGCTAQKVAADIGMSISTFSRRLAKHGTNFRQIREETIRTLACQALQHEELRISTIALRLGYSEPAAFNHAFKRLEGMSPRAYRRSISQL
jgi:AraC-like DNA-binding protein